MPGNSLIRRLLLPELELTASWFRPLQHTTHLEAEKKSGMEVCPRCATPSTSTYDHRQVRLKDAPLRDKAVVLWPQAAFLVQTVRKALHRARTGRPEGLPQHRAVQTQRPLDFSDLKAVRAAYRCSSGFVY
jgi:hypothetical protein